MLINDIIAEVKKYDCKLVELTGGEPLMQKESFELLKRLCDENFEVLLETGGSISIQDVDKRVKIIMDLKTPSSGMMEKNLLTNINYIKSSDEIKFVVADREDYEWSKQIIRKFDLAKKCSLLMGCVFEKLEPIELSNWILQDNLRVRFQLQLHKYIWEPNKRGV
jgi:7-carboxy-7-deazaguanine synthase